MPWYLDNVLQLLAIMLGLAANACLSWIVDDKTHDFAELPLQLVGDRVEDPMRHADLDRLFQWRDLVVGIITGAFVLGFAASSKVTSSSEVVVAISIGAVVLAPVLVLTATIVALRTDILVTENRWQYWKRFSICVVPWYAVASVFVFLAE